MDQGMVLHQIGTIRSMYRTRTEAPRQGIGTDAVSELELFSAYTEGLEGIDVYRYLLVLWWADQAERNLLRVVPPGETIARGVFSTRSPARPNPIGLSLVRVVNRTCNRIRVQWLEAVDGTPLIDLKPYSPGLDCVEE